jgi:hypothetical protein
MLREWTTIATALGVAPTLSSGATYTMSGRPIIRHRNFYPALYWPDDQRGQPIMTGPEGRRWYDLDLTLEVDWALMDAVDGQVFRGSSGVSIADTLESIAGRNARAGVIGSLPLGGSRLGGSVRSKVGP